MLTSREGIGREVGAINGAATGGELDRGYLDRLSRYA
jgi:hypothetical protein